MVRKQHVQEVEHSALVFGQLLHFNISRQLNAQLIEGRADHDLEVDAEHVAETGVVVERKHTEWDVIALYA